jgi:hypothetical protein
MRGGGLTNYPKIKLFLNQLANFFKDSLSYQAERHDERVQSVSQKRYRPLPPTDRAAFQHHRRASVKSDCARVFVDGHSDYAAESADWLAEAENQRDGQPLSLHLPLHLPRKILRLRRLPARWELILSAPMRWHNDLFKRLAPMGYVDQLQCLWVDLLN